jgi:hypothetical protein
MKSLINSENSSSNPLQETCSVFQVAACYSKSCSESHLFILKLFQKPVRTCTLEKVDQCQEGKPEQKF